MKVIVAGSRWYKKYGNIEKTLDKLLFFNDNIDNKELEIVCGTARGVDTLGEEYSRKRKLKLKKFEPNWKKQGNSAGAIRNKMMARYSDMLIAFWDGKSKGTQDMINKAFQHKLKILIIGIYEN